MKSYGYVRVSTGRQAKDGWSPDAQKHEIDRYFKENLAEQGYEWGGFFEDSAVSGKKPIAKRPAGAKLSAAIESGDVVVFAKLDRGFRSLADLLNTHETWHKRGVEMHLLNMAGAKVDTKSPLGKLLMHVLGAVAEFERSLISERTKIGLAARQLAGKPPIARRKYGFKPRKQGSKTILVRDDYTRKLGQAFIKWRMAGWTFQEIELHLLKHQIMNISTGKPKPWTHGAIFRAYQGELKIQAVEAEEQPYEQQQAESKLGIASRAAFD